MEVSGGLRGKLGVPKEDLGLPRSRGVPGVDFGESKILGERRGGCVSPKRVWGTRLGHVPREDFRGLWGSFQGSQVRGVHREGF